MAATVAPRIRSAIADAGLTQEAVGQKMGVSGAAVSKWRKSGQITLTNLFRLAEITGKPMAWFLPGYSEDQEADDETDALSLLLDRLDEKQLERLLSDVLSAKLSRTER